MNPNNNSFRAERLYTLPQATLLGAGDLFYVDQAASQLYTSKKVTFATLAQDIGNTLTITPGNLPNNIPATKIADGTIDNTEFQYLNGVTSNIQTQINSKQGTITLTTTGSSGAATLIGNTLNIPQYAGATYTAGNGLALSAGVFSIDTAITADLSTAQTLTNKNLTAGTNTFPTFNQNTTGSAAKWTTARLLAGNSVDGSANVPFVNKFLVQGTADTGLTGAQFMGALTTGIVKNTITTGVQSIAVAGTDYQAPITLTTTGTSGAATFIANTLNIPQYTGGGGGGTTTPYAETPSGLLNGSNTVFTLANTPANSAGVIIQLDGVTHRNGIDYTVTGTSITFATAPASTTGEIFAYYNTASTGTGLPYIDVTTTTQTLAANTVYYANNASLVTFTLPAIFNQNDVFQIIGKGAGGWKVAQLTGQTIRLTSTSTTTGTGGSIASTNRYDNLVIRGLIANTDLTATGRNGTLTVV